MTPGGKRGNPNAGFPLFPPSLEIAPRFPHSHRHDYGFILVQAINYTPLNCHPCPRAKVLPMSPAAPGCLLPAPERGGRPLEKASSAPFRGWSSLPTYPHGSRRGLFSFAPSELEAMPDAGKRSALMSCTLVCWFQSCLGARPRNGETRACAGRSGRASARRGGAMPCHAGKRWLFY